MTGNTMRLYYQKFKSLDDVENFIDKYDLIKNKENKNFSISAQLYMNNNQYIKNSFSVKPDTRLNHPYDIDWTGFHIYTGYIFDNKDLINNIIQNAYIRYIDTSTQIRLATLDKTEQIFKIFKKLIKNNYPIDESLFTKLSIFLKKFRINPIDNIEYDNRVHYPYEGYDIKFPFMNYINFKSNSHFPEILKRHICSRENILNNNDRFKNFDVIIDGLTLM